MLHVDKDIFAAAQAGDRAALERLLLQLRPDIQRYARFQCYASCVAPLAFALLAVAVSTGDPLVAIPALLVALIAFRGCPICWVFGLFARASQGFAPSARKEAP